MVKGSSCAESGPHASLHSGSTHQQVLSTSHDNNNSSMHVDSAPATAAPSNQPASPESVNDGQATPAPAPKSPSLPANTQNNVSTKDVAEGAEGVPDPAAVQAAAVPPAPAQHSPTPVEPSAEEAARLEQALEPLPAPSASEDAEVHAEYEVYLARWRAGTTLRQRWHRCGQPGSPLHNSQQQEAHERQQQCSSAIYSCRSLSNLQHIALLRLSVGSRPRDMLQGSCKAQQHLSRVVCPATSRQLLTRYHFSSHANH